MGRLRLIGPFAADNSNRIIYSFGMVLGSIGPYGLIIGRRRSNICFPDFHPVGRGVGATSFSAVRDVLSA